MNCVIIMLFAIVVLMAIAVRRTPWGCEYNHNFQLKY